MRLAIFLLFCVGIVAAVPLQSRDVDGPDVVMQAEEDAPTPEQKQQLVNSVEERITTIIREGNYEELHKKLLEEIDAEGFEEVMKLVFGEESELANDVIAKVKERGEEGKHDALEWIDMVMPDTEERSISKRDVPTDEQMEEFVADMAYEIGEKCAEENGNELYQKIVHNLDAEEVEEVMKQVFGEDNEESNHFIRMVKESGDKEKHHIMDWAEVVMPGIAKRSISARDVSMDEKLQEYANDMIKRIEAKGEEGRGEEFQQNLHEEIDAEEFLEAIKITFGEESELANQIIRMVQESGEEGRHHLMEWIDIIMPDREERSVSDTISGFFKSIKEQLGKKKTQFTDWVKGKFKSTIQKGKSNVDNMIKLLEEFIKDIKTMGDDMKKEGVEFFKKYRDNLGSLYKKLIADVGTTLKS